MLTSSLLYHYNRADYDGASWDYPISTTDQRSSTYFGGQESLHVSAGRNTLEAGLYGFGQHDLGRFRMWLGAPRCATHDTGGTLNSNFPHDLDSTKSGHDV